MKSRNVTRSSLISALVVCTFILASSAQLRNIPPKLSPTDSTQASLLHDLLPESGQERRSQALQEIARTNEKRYIAPLIDLLRFVSSRQDLAVILKTLNKLTGKNWGDASEPWEQLTIWYGEHAELQPPSGYTGWKGDLHAQLIDPRFHDFFYDGAPATVRVEEAVWGGVKVDGIPALVNPHMIPAAEAHYLTDSEPVFGVSINGDNRAYPLRILDWHEMADDIVGGKHVALAYCTLCGSGVLFDASADGKTFEFGSSGFLFRSNKLMYDRETNTLWNQLTGEPVIGKLAGSNIKLKVLPDVLTSWGDWRRQHPDTKVLDIKTGFDRPYEVGATYGRYFGSPDTMFPVWQQSKLLPKKERIFAIQAAGLAKAYPLDTLNRSGGVVNDTLGSLPLVVIYRDAVGQVSLPSDWVTALHEVRGGKSHITNANDLSLADARAVLQKHPALVKDMNANFLLAMPTEDRLTLLHERTSEARQGSQAEEGHFAPDLRNEVAQRGLIGETRAYQRRMHSFTASSSKEGLLDEQGHGWHLTEDALVSADGERLARLGGHLSYWFGWFSFYPKTEVYQIKPSHGIAEPSLRQ